MPAAFSRSRCSVQLRRDRSRTPRLPTNATTMQRRCRSSVRLADQGDAFAQYDLGVMYANGQGVPQDYAQAVAWYRKAADQGNAAAQTNLGVMYARRPRRAAGLRAGRRLVPQGRRPGERRRAGQPRRDVRQRPRRAAGLCPRSYVAQLGGVALDDATRQMRSKCAMTAPRAVKARDDVAAKMTPAQIAEAQRLAREWKPSSRVGDAQGSGRAPSVSATLEPPVGARGETCCSWSATAERSRSQ